MKMNKKKVLASAVAVCIIAILSLGTIAYFNATDEVTNTFMVADSTDDPDELFSVDLFEHEVDENGETTEEEVEANTYDNIAPGDVLSKDPTVRNTGKYDQWIRLQVTLTDAEDWMTILTENNITDITTIFGGYDGSKWQSEGNDAPALNADGSLTFTYYLKERLAPEATATLFTSVKIPSVLDQEDLAKVPTFNINIVAQAIQADNTGDTAAEAFTNWE